jgi:hypothetical protein
MSLLNQKDQEKLRGKPCSELCETFFKILSHCFYACGGKEDRSVA